LNCRAEIITPDYKIHHCFAADFIRVKSLVGENTDLMNFKNQERELSKS